MTKGGEEENCKYRKNRYTMKKDEKKKEECERWRDRTAHDDTENWVINEVNEENCNNRENREKRERQMKEKEVCERL